MSETEWVTHRVRMHESEDGERAYWECDCGSAGSCAVENVDIVSDRHIPAGDHRIDVSGGTPW